MAEETKQPEADAQAEPDAAGAQASAEEGGAEAAPESAADQLTLDEAQAWSGFRLDDVSNSTVGKVEGVYVDESSGRPEWLLARMGRFGHHCLLPARDAVAASGHVWVPYSRDQIRKAPRIEKNKPLERGQEVALLDHYGVGSAEVGRGADLAGKDPSAVTARPAD